MKKTKIIILTAMTLVAIMLLSSCAAATEVPLQDLLNKNEEFNVDPLYSTGDIAASLSDVTFVESAGNLVHFTKLTNSVPAYTAHLVYNMETDTIVYNASNGTYRSVNIELSESFFVVTTTYYESVLDVVTGSQIVDYYETCLYNAGGTLLEDVQNRGIKFVGPDLVYADGSMYRYDENVIEFAFDYPEISDIPNVTKRSEEYYYEFNLDSTSSYYSSMDRSIRVYDLQLNYVSTYEIPGYYDLDRTEIAVLENSNLFIQCMYGEPDDATEYTFIVDESIEIPVISGDVNTGFTTDYEYIDQYKKYTLVSGIVNVKDGSFTESDIPYVFTSFYPVDYYTVATNNGFNTEDISGVAISYNIDNKRISNSNEIAFLKNDGSYFTINDINGAPVVSCVRIAEDRWVVTTTATSYVVDNGGNILGDVGRASVCGRILYGSGKAFDANINMVYDYQSADMTVAATLTNALILRKDNGDYYIYNGNSNPSRIAEAESGRYIYSDISSSYQKDYLIVKDTNSSYSDAYEFYNGNGQQILTIRVDKESSLSVTSLNIVAIGNGYLLFSVTDYTGETVYYTLSGR